MIDILTKALRSGALAIAFFCVAYPAAATDIRVLCIPGMKASIDTLIPEFERISGHKVSVTYEIYAGQKARIDSGDFDVPIFAKSQIDEMSKRGLIAPGSVANIASTNIGIAVKTGAPHPDIHDEAAFKHLMLSARSITYTENSSTGVYVTKLLARLGLTEQIKNKLLLQAGGAMTTPAVAQGKAEIGIVLISDILATPGVDLVGPLPPGLQNEVMQSAGIDAKEETPNNSKAFIEYLKSPTASAAFESKGLQPAAH
jgi:molybdate transport system substrate-binding protein